VTDLHTIPCPKCRQPAGQVIHAESQTRKGWWCAACREWIPAILRERKVEDMAQEPAP
jgi:uncharacterized protein YbaR (Trm112 family)